MKYLEKAGANNALTGSRGPEPKITALQMEPQLTYSQLSTDGFSRADGSSRRHASHLGFF
jgi:hypothetical protein